MVKQIIFLLLTSAIFSFSSCEEGVNEEEAIDLEEFLPKSKKEYNYKQDTLKEVEEHTPDSIELLIKSRIGTIDFISEDELRNNKHFPDRLDFTKKFYHELMIDSSRNELVIWEFEDSLHTVNAFYNWIDCFGSKCKSITVGEEKWIYSGSFQLFVDDKKLIYVATDNKMNQKLWADFFEPTLKNSWNYHLYQPLKGKVKWLGQVD